MTELTLEEVKEKLKDGYKVRIVNPYFDDCIVEEWTRTDEEGMHIADDESGAEFMGFDEVSPDDKFYLEY